MVVEDMGTEGGSSEHKVGGENGVVVHVRCSNGSKFDVTAALDSTIGSFKAVVAQKCDVPADQQRLIYKGRILKDDQTLESYGLQADHTIHMVRGFTPNASTPAAATANAGNPNAPLGVTRGVGSNPGGGFGGAGVGVGAPGLFGAGLPEFDQQNPNTMSDIMNTPAIQSLMNNPDIMRGLIMSNPQMRDIIDRNPELAHILNDPAILRQTLEASRNPELMREMMRNTDRAMSNIESSPEGFNMLRRMYENVQEPFLNATTMGGNAGNDVGSNPFAALSENQAGSNNLSTNSESTTGPAAPNTNPLPNPWNSASGGTQTNTTTRSTPVGEARAPGVGGLGGLPGMQNMPDTAQLNQMMQNPAVSQMMQSLLSDPQYMNQILNLNPQLRSMVDMNPQLREMMQNPELLRQLTSPETMQQMLTLQQSLNRPQATQTPTQSGGDMDLLMNMFAGLEAGGMSGPNTPNVPPEELYATQLSQLQEMGFFDTQENIRALRASSGNVHAAVERLLGNPGA